LPTQDKDLLPEARMTRFQTGVPKYAISRGLDIETCRTWGLGYDKLAKRLVFPVRRYDGKLIGLTGRDITGQAAAKYHNYSGLDKARYIFGEHMLKAGEPIILCEGQIDAIITWQHLGVPTVAPLGEGFSEHHVRTICAHQPPVVYLFPDNDPPGRLAAEKMEYALHGRVVMKLMLPPLGMDPGELTVDESKTALASSKKILGRINWAPYEEDSL